MINYYEKMKDFYELGLKIDEGDYESYDMWNNNVSAYLVGLGDNESHSTFWRFRADDSEDFHNGLSNQLEVIQALMTAPEKLTLQAQINNNSKDVFIVHGHDSGIKESTARFLQKLRLNPIILHEQPNSGNTIIEKFEKYATVGFAIILLTSDDEGKSKKVSELKPRARQNVIFELGYFFGKIGRSRVCALYEEGVEIPSDYKSILYIKLDDAEGWKRKLTQELINAKMDVDINGLIG